MRTSTILALIACLLLIGCVDRGTRAEFESRRPWLKPEVITPATADVLGIVVYRDQFPELGHAAGSWSTVRGKHTIAHDQAGNITGYGWTDE